MSNTSAKKEYYYGTGRRKSSVAQVRLYKGKGKSTVNGKDRILSDLILSPLKLVGMTNAFDISIKVHGGGTTGQSEAMRHGISRALVVANKENRPVLKKAGYLTRDSREVERKKPGLKKARRAPQSSKR